MFAVKNPYSTNTELPLIVDSYKVLHFDEFPILFTGVNKFGNKLIGSYSYEDEENDFYRFFVVLVQDKVFFDFYDNKISYRDIIHSSSEVYIVDRDINEKLISSFAYPVAELPLDFLPHTDSYIPISQKASNSLNFSFSLQGGLADFHKSFVSDVNSINQRINDFLEESLNVLKGFSLKPKIFSQPSQIGSYRLNFDIEFDKQSQISMFPINEDAIAGFLNDYIHYISSYLPHEVNDFLDNSPNSQKFKLLESSLSNVYSTSHKIPSDALNFSLIDDINNAAIKLTEVTDFLKISDSFNKIELGKIDNHGSFSGIGVLDSGFRDNIISKLLPEDEILTFDDDVTSDLTPQNYRILVYDLNLHSGKGGASLFYEGENFHKVRLHIEKGDKELSNSVFTKSMDENKVIDVKGIAVKKGSKYRKLNCFLT